LSISFDVACNNQQHVEPPQENTINSEFTFCLTYVAQLGLV